jgi:hypothetical protein
MSTTKDEMLNGGTTTGATCFVLCKLPTGLIIESGYTFAKNGIGISRLPNYKRVILAGANKRILELARQAGPNQVPTSPKNFQAGITANVDEAFFDKWVHDHKFSNIVKNRLVWKCKTLAEAQAQAIDDLDRTTGMEARPQVQKEGKFELRPFDANDNSGSGQDAA